MKFRDGVLALAAIIGVIILGAVGAIPFTFSTIVLVGIGIVTALFWRNPNFLAILNKDYSIGSMRGNDLTVDPNDALEWLQDEWIPKHKGKKKLNLDSTSVQNKKHFTKIQKVNENGEKKVKFGVIGRPLDMKDREMIAYVVHCDEGWVQYSGELHTAEDRLDPFNGQHQWMQNAGYKARVDSGDGSRQKGSVNIYQGESSNMDEVGDET